MNLVFIIITVSISLLIGIAVGTDNSGLLNKCAEENNVYRCEMIAVPKKGQHHE